MKDRPVVSELLVKVQDGKYDAVLVIHYDRLSRGDSSDFSMIKDVLIYSKTYLVTQERLYDLSTPADLMLLGVESVMSNTELNLIKYRLKWGKMQGAVEGRLSNGEPPYPYQKIRTVGVNDKGKVRILFDIVVNEEKKVVYKQVLKMYLEEGMGVERISRELNKTGVKSPAGTVWSSNAILRLLTHEFHTGKIVYGKYEWKKKPLTGEREVTQRNESEWSVGIGSHELLKTEEQHNKIMDMLQKNRKIPHAARHGAYPTSGLLTCKLCGRIMVYSAQKTEVKSGKRYDYVKCYYHTPVGEKCPQRGVKMDENFYDALYATIISSYINKERIKQINDNRDEKTKIEKHLQNAQKELLKHEKALKVAREKLEEGLYSDEDFMDAKRRRNPEIFKLKKDIIELENTRFTAYSDAELELLVNNFKEKWYSATTDLEKNELLKTVVKKIFYNREEDTVTFEIEYL